MGRSLDSMVAIVHDSEESISRPFNRDGPGSYSRILVYFIGMDKIKALTNLVLSPRNPGTALVRDSLRFWQTLRLVESLADDDLNGVNKE
ncbi:hypothetical protein NPIL_75071 [Nephila pilipes]|uniref:Uncharacterized protein n=1 Tax=Nephila pilipes TaxID=299642 RepID=A0A8X6JHT1_NEPPI|nr:hypothetical protein NPIL_75071 [Nephila pilipes]